MKISETVFGRRFYNIAPVLLSLIFISGCIQKGTVTYVARHIEPVLNEGAVFGTNAVVETSGPLKIKGVSSADVSLSREIEHLQKYFNSWQGVRYKYGGLSTKGVDCSGLTLCAYKELYGVNLPRTVAKQARKGILVQRKYLRPGDLVFFKTGRYSRHVGIYLGESQFIHASRSKGVIQSDLDSVYWQKKFWQAKRFQS